MVGKMFKLPLPHTSHLLNTDLENAYALVVPEQLSGWNGIKSPKPVFLHFLYIVGTLFCFYLIIAITL